MAQSAAEMVAKVKAAAACISEVEGGAAEALPAGPSSTEAGGRPLVPFKWPTGERVAVVHKWRYTNSKGFDVGSMLYNLHFSRVAEGASVLVRRGPIKGVGPGGGGLVDAMPLGSQAASVEIGVVNDFEVWLPL